MHGQATQGVSTWDVPERHQHLAAMEFSAWNSPCIHSSETVLRHLRYIVVYVCNGADGLPEFACFTAATNRTF